MARDSDYCYEQGQLIRLSFREWILPGSFEYAPSHVIDHELDLSIVDRRYGTEDAGRPAHDPGRLRRK